MLGGALHWTGDRFLCPIDVDLMAGLQERWRELRQLVVAEVKTEDDKQQECSLQGEEHLPTHGGRWLQPSGRTAGRNECGGRSAR